MSQWIWPCSLIFSNCSQFNQNLSTISKVLRLKYRNTDELVEANSHSFLGVIVTSTRPNLLVLVLLCQVIRFPQSRSVHIANGWRDCAFFANNSRQMLAVQGRCYQPRVWWRGNITTVGSIHKVLYTDELSGQLKESLSTFTILYLASWCRNGVFV